jgi:glycosidase
MTYYRPALLEFHVARQARDYYRFEDTLFAYNGNIIFANFHAARVFAQKMNDRRDLVRFPEKAVRAGQINAMGLIDEILHMVVEQYRRERNPAVMQQAVAWLNEQVGEEELEIALREFIVEFPPTSIYRLETSLDDYLQGESLRPDGQLVANRELVLEEMIMLWLANMNPAFAPYLELFDDERLERSSAYLTILDSLKDFFDTQPKFGPENQNLIDMLRAPALADPYSLTGQLEFIRTRWTTVLGRFLYRLLSSLDLVKEEEKIIFGVGGSEGVPAVVIEFTGLEFEPERFSPDRDWMPHLVLMAKNSYVWLDQLSKKYKRPITRLDQIPDEELDTLARWGLTGLWLIGLWERSIASRTIKQLRGNPDAVASAYSLMNYNIAADLGGEEAYRTLREKAWRRGIRLASDMVPNHMGVDSNWVMEHPDWFIGLDYPPFPSYTFNGPNLSWDNRVGLFIEDHYYNNTDAAVVFKRIDFWTGSEKYIYHGNDGTSMPWNDTAQLNYLIPEVREAVIQTILHVARMFPVIRFDAAMTLAKKHYQRLWFPEPGRGGDIPSRAEFALTKEQFDAAFPVEFWREVVDRVAQEAPDTLLLAEAFWLMEGYFVRTLGMHRVYNSAFMNMLRDEKNQEYRLVIKNTLEFEPEILKRYVNFMNNPDERTAVDQFGKGDKYFGILTMLATMPGLPMIGHGQVEGFTEKYGMEYRRAYWDEHPDGYLVERHEREIFPLLRKRYLFSDVRDFLLYDFYTPEGYVNEDVFAYSNRTGDERALILYQNKFASTRGWIRISTPYPFKTGDGDQRVAVQKPLGEGLGLHNDPNFYTIFRDQNNSLEFIRNSQELHEKGLYAELNAYQYHVFIDFREVQDTPERRYAYLAEFLAGRGVPDIEEALQELFLQPLHTPYRELVNAGWFKWLVDNRLKDDPRLSYPDQLAAMRPVLDEAQHKSVRLYQEIDRMTETPGDPDHVAAQTCQELQDLLTLPAWSQVWPADKPGGLPAGVLSYLQAGPRQRLEQDGADAQVWGVLFAWLFNRQLNRAASAVDSPEQSRAWMDEWLLGKLIVRTLIEFGLEEGVARQQVELVKLLVGHQQWYIQKDVEESLTPYSVLHKWLKDSGIQHFLQINRYQGVLWFNREAFEELLWWMYTVAALQIVAGQPRSAQAEAAIEGENGAGAQLESLYMLIMRLQKAEQRSSYQVEKLLEAVED